MAIFDWLMGGPSVTGKGETQGKTYRSGKNMFGTNVNVGAKAEAEGQASILKKKKKVSDRSIYDVLKYGK